MRHAHFCLYLSLLLAATTAAAQPSSLDPLDAQAPTSVLEHQRLQPSGEIVRQPGSWTAANQAVAAFPNGHADIVQWEAKQSPSGQKAPEGTAPAHQHSAPMPMHHHGARP